MFRVYIIMLVGSLAVLGNAGLGLAQATIQGKVVDAATGKPLEDTHVYLSGTKIGTASSAGGQYILRQISPGGYRLIVSRVGYKTEIMNIVFGPKEHKKMDFKLKSVVYNLPEIYVGDFGKEWKQNLEHFIEHFIGESSWADSVEIINPKVLRFNKKWWGKLTAEALAPLQIENHALGYYITYHLKEFNHSGDRTRWDGEPLFTEMTPVDSAQAAYWERNRKKAFYGSIRHFLLGLVNNHAEQEGFILYNHRENVRGYSPQNKFRIRGDQLIEEGEEDYLYKLNFFGRLEIIYMHEREDSQYTNWLRNSRRTPGGAQTSYLELNEHPVTVDADGEIIQPYGATQFGYFSFSRVASLTPREYRPQEYKAKYN